MNFHEKEHRVVYSWASIDKHNRSAGVKHEPTRTSDSAYGVVCTVL